VKHVAITAIRRFLNGQRLRVRDHQIRRYRTIECTRSAHPCSLFETHLPKSVIALSQKSVTLQGISLRGTNLKSPCNE
jgi:hypothetical protein